MRGKDRPLHYLYLQLLSPSGDLEAKLFRIIHPIRHLGLSIPDCFKPFNDDLTQPQQTRPGNPGHIVIYMGISKFCRYLL